MESNKFQKVVEVEGKWKASSQDGKVVLYTHKPVGLKAKEVLIDNSPVTKALFAQKYEATKYANFLNTLKKHLPNKRIMKLVKSGKETPYTYWSRMDFLKGADELFDFLEKPIPKVGSPQRTGYFAATAIIVAGMLNNCLETEINDIMTDSLRGVFNRFADVLPELTAFIFDDLNTSDYTFIESNRTVEGYAMVRKDNSDDIQYHDTKYGQDTAGNQYYVSAGNSMKEYVTIKITKLANKTLTQSKAKLDSQKKGHSIIKAKKDFKEYIDDNIKLTANIKAHLLVCLNECFKEADVSEVNISSFAGLEPFSGN